MSRIGIAGANAAIASAPSSGGSRRRWLKQALGGAATVAMPLWARAAGNTIKVGLSLPLTAPSASDAASATNIVPDLGLDYLAGFNAAIEMEKHGLNIEPLVLDDNYRTDKARANVEELEKQGVVAMSGAWTTSQTRAMLPVLRRAGLPMVGLRSGAPELRDGKNPMLFHVRPGYDDEIVALVNVMGGAGFTQFGVLHANDEFSTMGLELLRATRAKVIKAQGIASIDSAAAANTAREIVSTPGVQALLVLTPVDVLAPVMTELRIRNSPFLAPVSALSHVLCTKLSSARDPVYRAFAVTCPYPNPNLARSDIAVHFRDAMQQAGLDHADKSYSAFEGFVAGTLVTRAMLNVRGPVTRDALVKSLRSRPYNLGGMRVEFDERQVGLRQVSFLYKSPVDGNFRA